MDVNLFKRNLLEISQFLAFNFFFNFNYAEHNLSFLLNKKKLHRFCKFTTRNSIYIT